jgi:hypothetical protein
MDCKKKHEMTHFLTKKHENQEPEFDLSYQSKAKSEGFKPLDFGIKDSLLYAVT